MIVEMVVEVEGGESIEGLGNHGFHGLHGLTQANDSDT